MKVSYQHHREAWEGFNDFLSALILEKNIKSICEVGGGANPSISLAFIEKHGLDYTLLDISAKELAKAPRGYVKVIADIAQKLPEDLYQQYDLVLSKMLMEHVSSGQTFHQNVRELLKPGGFAFHFFPTLYALPFAINKIMPETFSSRLLAYLVKGRSSSGNSAKFPGFYRMCFGPTKKQIKWLESVGYQVEKYIGFFGHDYFKKTALLDAVSKKITALLLKYPIPYLTSYSYLVLQKKQSEHHT